MNFRRVMARVLPVAGTLAGLAFLVHVSQPHWNGVRAASRGIDGAWVGAGAAALVVHYGIVFVIWRLCLRASGLTVTRREAADMWIPSLLARYVPGKVWAHGVRVALARRAGISLPMVTGAVGWEILLSVSGAAVMAFAALQAGEARVAAGVRVAVTALMLVCLTAVATAQLLAWRAGARRWVARIGLSRPLSLATLAAVAAAHLAGWVVYGLAHWCIARALAPVSPAAFHAITGAVALAWIGGYLSFFTPAGLGVREGLLALLLAPLLGAGTVVVLAAVARLLSVAVEAMLFAAWSTQALWSPKASRNRDVAA